MKLFINKLFSLLSVLLVLCAICFSTGCGKAKNVELSAANVTDTLLTFVKQTEIKTKLDKYWQLDFIKEWYQNRIEPPPLATSGDLTKLSFQELWFSKYEILARNGYLFMEPTLRAHFNKMKWYQPIFGVDDFVVEVNAAEYNYLTKIIVEEKKRLAALRQSGSYRLWQYLQSVNLDQFKAIPQDIAENLINKNFIIFSANHDQLFHVYEQNVYDYTPSFITTDLFFQVVQKHIAVVMKNLEKEKLVGMMHAMLTELYNNSQALIQQSSSVNANESAEWSMTFYAIALSLLTEKEYTVPERFKLVYKEELTKCQNALGFNSGFLNSKLAEYSQFMPRGNYAGDPVLEKYFRCIKWLNSAKIVITEPASLMHPVCLAYVINNSPNASAIFNKFSDVVQFLAGDENNISVTQISSILKTSFPNKKLEEIIQPENLKKLYGHLQARDPRKFQIPTGTQFAKEQYSKMTVLFSAGRYTLDNEIYSKLVHLMQPEPKRKTPKALDIFAAMGNHAADSILRFVYKEQERWPAYDDSLNLLKKKFQTKNNWEASIFSKTMHTIFGLSEKHENYPPFMLTPYWEKKNLNTALGGYTQLRHDFTLYIEEIMAAEYGGGDDGPPPPVHLAYVEPNMAFWSRSAELLKLLEKKLDQNGLLVEKTKDINNRLLSLNKFLSEMSQKELAGIRLTDNELEELSAVGGTIESITLNLLESDHLPDRDKELSLVINVYGYRDEKNNTFILNEALGKADEIYVVTLINGLPYITKGAVWSHYEFITKQAMTDDEWKKEIKDGNIPPMAGWMRDIKIKSKSLETKPENRFQ